MGLCCCKVKDDDEVPRNRFPPQLQRTRTNEIPQGPAVPPIRPQLAQTTKTSIRTVPVQPGIISVNEQIATAQEFRKILEHKKTKLILYRKKVNIDLKLLVDLLQAMHISIEDIPMIKVYTLKHLDVNSEQYALAMSKFANKKFRSEYTIDYILHVWNPYIFAQFKLKKMMVYTESEKIMLYHGTTVKNLEGILTNNFDWRKVINSKCGRGISFANNPWYASHYSTKDSNGSYDTYDYVMILAKVLVGQTSYGNKNTMVPKRGCDTTTRPQDRQVMVKYDDCTFYPEFLVYFTRKRPSNRHFAYLD